MVVAISATASKNPVLVAIGMTAMHQPQPYLAATLSTPSLGQRLFHYRDTNADREVMRQMFTDAEYSIGRLRRGEDIVRAYNDIVTRGKTPLIVDAGANIGASVVWFAGNFPMAHILAFEPESRNFDLLKANTAGLNVDLRLAAIGAVDGQVEILNADAPAWEYRTAVRAGAACEMISLTRVLNEKQAQDFEALIIKIDIEGGEDELFSTSTEWVEVVPLIIIELHDWLYPRKGTSANFLRAIAHTDRDFVHIGENIFSISNVL